MAESLDQKQKIYIDELLKKVDSILQISQINKLKIYELLLAVYRRDKNAVAVLDIKTFVSQLLSTLKTMTQDLDELSEKSELFQNLLVCPNLLYLRDNNQYNIAVDLLAPKKTIGANEYENMLKQQLFTEQVIQKRYDMQDYKDNENNDKYWSQNKEWKQKMENINRSINSCIQFAEKNL